MPKLFIYKMILYLIIDYIGTCKNYGEIYILIFYTKQINR